MFKFYEPFFAQEPVIDMGAIHSFANTILIIEPWKDPSLVKLFLKSHKD
jgi:hypothetical protein